MPAVRCKPEASSIYVGPAASSHFCYLLACSLEVSASILLLEAGLRHLQPCKQRRRCSKPAWQLCPTKTGLFCRHHAVLLTLWRQVASAHPGCRDPALAAFEAEEVLQRGSLAFVSGLASSVATGVLGIARAAVVGRPSGYRAGSCTHSPNFNCLC